MTSLTLREDILACLQEQPLTNNGIAKILGRDKASIHRLLLVLQRKGVVRRYSKRIGKVTYKFWVLVLAEN